VGIDVEPDLVGGLLEGLVEAGFGFGVEGEVGNIAAVRADEVVVVFGEVFGEFIAGKVVAGDDAGHGADFFEDGQVSVDAGLGERGVGGQDLGDGEWAITGLQHPNKASATGRVALVGLAE